MRYCLIGFLMLFLVACAERNAGTDAQASDEPVASAPSNQEQLKRRIIDSAGVRHYRDIQSLRFTFNVSRGTTTTRRHWLWEPHQDRVTRGREGDLDHVTFVRGELTDASHPNVLKADQQFTNDSFWLLPQLHLMWTDDVTLEDHGSAPLPIGSGSGRHVIVTYPPGYSPGSSPGHTTGQTPGDVYELFLDDQHRIAQWIFRRGGAEKPNLNCTWQNYVTAGPFTMAMDHHTADGSFRLWFTDVAVTMGK